MRCYYTQNLKCPFCDASGMDKLCCECDSYNNGKIAIHTKPEVIPTIPKNFTPISHSLNKFIGVLNANGGHKLILSKPNKH